MSYPNQTSARSSITLSPTLTPTPLTDSNSEPIVPSSERLDSPSSPFPEDPKKQEMRLYPAAPLTGLNSPSIHIKDPWRVCFEGKGDPLHPTNRSTGKKWSSVVVISSGAACVTCASSMGASTYNGLESDLGVSQEIAILSISLFVFGLGLGPLLSGPLSESLGRNKVYHFSFLAFILLNLPVAFANNVAVEMVFRFLTGFAGSAFLSVAGGSVADLFENDKVGPPMAFYTLAPFLGPILGPLISGFINQNTSWRWTYYVVIVWASVELFLLFFFVPETHVATILTRRAQKMRKETKEERWYAPAERREKSFFKAMKTSCTTPFYILASEPMVLLLNLWTSVLLGILYRSTPRSYKSDLPQTLTGPLVFSLAVNFNAYPFVFRKIHGFSLQESGLSFLGIGIGMVMATASQPYWNKLYLRSVNANGGIAPPESRLPPGMLGAILCPLSLFLFAATSMEHVHWIVPMMMSIPFGMGATLCFQSVFTFLVDAYRPFAASAMASNSFMRSSFAAGFPLFSNQMYTKLGSVGAGCLLGGMLLLMAPLPFIFFRYGARIRARSKFGGSS